MSFAKVAIAGAGYAFDAPYDYAVPDNLSGTAIPGVRILVPFGRGNKKTEGIIISLAEKSEYEQTKPILTVLDEKPVLDENAIRLALWMREQCFCSFYDAVRAMLPTGVLHKLKDICVLAEGVNEEKALLACETPGEEAVIKTVLSAGGKTGLAGLEELFDELDAIGTVKTLVEKGILKIDIEAGQTASVKTSRFARLIVSSEEALSFAERKRSRAKGQSAVLELLAGLEEAPVKEICYFTGAAPASLKALEKQGFIEIYDHEEMRLAIKDREILPPPELHLNDEQQRVADGLWALADSGKPAAALLFGVTGSGKTSVYIELIKKVISRGKSAIVLVPEISLTPQLIGIFYSHFGGRTAVLHSALGIGERYDEWRRIAGGEVDVVVGTRSAIFAPLMNLGVIIIDEEQEHTYKSENSPRYHAREVAKYRCVQNSCLLILGSATPSVESMHSAVTGKYTLFTLKERFNQGPLPRVEIVDMKEELKRGNSKLISSVLYDEINANIQRGEQTILFINRRGYHRFVTCGECGTAPFCPRCSVTLTYHSANERFMCHHCGYSEKLYEKCPECSGDMKMFGAGTQKAAEELEELFPGVKVIRMDADTTMGKNAHEKLFAKFRKERGAILLGTQMVAKGLDFEAVTLVGVLAADLSLYLGGFRGYERTFSLITQSVGRAGRGENKGRAVIQAFSPAHPVIKSAAEQDYEAFFTDEIQLRDARNLPPYRDIFMFTVTGAVEMDVLRAAMRLRGAFDKVLPGAEIYGPAPAPVVKVNNRYRYRLTIHGKNDKTFRLLTANILRGFSADKQNRGVLAYADLNPEW